MGLFDQEPGSKTALASRNRKLVILGPLTFAMVWILWAFGPAPEDIYVPQISVTYLNRPPPSPFNQTKVALIIENRPLPHLSPLLLHMISVVPPDWRFLFLGSQESINHVNTSRAVQHHERNGKLDMRLIPNNVSIAGQEEVSQLLTSNWFYDQMVGPAEWLLHFQSDSIMCANSELSLNSWLKYDWVGAPWSVNDKYGGNGGLSLRRVSAIRKVLQFQERPVNAKPEDAWFVERLGNLPNSKMANSTQEAEFSVEGIWHDFPMGYHLGASGKRLPEGVWKDKAQRDKIYQYCPEIKMIMNMKLERERCTADEISQWDQAKENEAKKAQTTAAATPKLLKRELDPVPIAMW